MPGKSDWLTQLGEGFSTSQEAEILSLCMQAERRMPIKWVGVCTQYNGYQGVFAVSCDALALAHPAGQVRVNVTYQGAQTLCDGLGLQMPTPLMVDKIWEQAVERVTPKTYIPDAQARVHVHNRQNQGVTVSMMGITAMVAHSDRVQASMQGASSLVCNAGKWWVLTRGLGGQPQSPNPRHAYKVANYGWFASGAPNLSVSGKQLWQSLGTKHNQFHRDYSQTFVPVGSVMLVDGALIEVSEVLRDSKLCGLLSHEGPISFSRHPNMPLIDVDGAELSITPDPRYIPLVGSYETDAPTINDLPVLPVFIQAKNYRPTAGRTVDLLVIHTMEAVEKPTTARAVANWFAGVNAPKASAHYCIDAGEVVQCVQEKDVAWCAPGANHNGIHLEHAGYASQSPHQWSDVYSVSMLNRSAELAFRICERHQIPVEFLEFDELLQGKRGITTHAEVTKACAVAKKRAMASSPFFGAVTAHTDPGPNFPMGAYLQSILGRQ